MKSALQQPSCFSDETKDGLSNPSPSQNIHDSNNTTLSSHCPSLTHPLDSFVSLRREQVQQQFLNVHPQIFEGQNDATNAHNLKTPQIDSHQKLTLPSNIQPQDLRTLCPNADTNNSKDQIFDPSNMNIKTSKSENTSFPPTSFPASQPQQTSENYYPERSTAIILEDYQVQMPSATEINMETASCLWPEDQIKSNNLFYMKKQMGSQNISNSSLIQNGQQQYSLPYVGALYESYYPFMVYNNHSHNNHVNGFEDSQQHPDEMISPNQQFEDGNDDHYYGNCQKQFIPRFINKNLRGWQTQPKDSLECECPETLQSFSSIPYISERHSNVYSGMFQESKQTACLSSKIYPFQSNYSRPSYNPFQVITNKDALDFKSDRKDINYEEHSINPEINNPLISQVVHGQQGQEEEEESVKTQEQPFSKQTKKVNGIKNSLLKRKQLEFITPSMASNFQPCEDSAKEANDDENDSPHKFHLEDLNRPSFSFPSSGKLHETAIQEEEGEYYGQEGSAVSTLIMRLQQQQQQQKLQQQQQSRFSYNPYYYQNYQQVQNQREYFPQTAEHSYNSAYQTFQQQQLPTQSSQQETNQDKQGSDQYLYENDISPLGFKTKELFTKIPISELKEQYPNKQDGQIGIKNPSELLSGSQHSNIPIKLEKESESNVEQSLVSDSKQQDINEDIEKEDDQEDQKDEKQLKCYQSGDDTNSNLAIEDEDSLQEEHGCKKICMKDNSNVQKSKKKNSQLKRKESDTIVEVRRRQASSSSASCTSGNQTKNKFDTKNLVKNFLNQFLSFVSSEEEKTTIADLLPLIQIDQIFQDNLKAFFKHKKYNRVLLKEFIHIENYRILFSFFLRNRAQDWISYGRMKDKPSHLRALSNFIYICDNHDEIKSWRFRYNFV